MTEAAAGNRTVVITGGARGIGAMLSRAFHEAGYFVAMGGRQDNGLAAELGSRARFIESDVRLAESHERLVEAAMSCTGRLDVFINNAGLSGWRCIDHVDDAFWHELIDTNLKGTFLGCQAAARRLGRGGCILNVSSLAGKRGSANNAVYCASKFGVNGLTQALAKELGPRGIRVNAVCPVLVRTAGLLEALAQPDAPGEAGVEQFLLQFAASQSALGVLPTGGQIASVCLFLASPAASAITGQCLNVDCGVLPT